MKKQKTLKFIALILILFGLNLPCRAAAQDYLNAPFWQKFNDEILIKNLAKVFENNNDLKAASLKVSEAQRIVKMSFASELPNLNFTGYVGQIFNSSDELFGKIEIPDYTESHFLLPLTMNYEVDLWGKNHLKTKSKKKQLEMISQDEKSAYIFITSAFAADYFNLIRCDKLIEYQNKLINLQEEILSSYQKRYEFGSATVSEIEKAQIELENKKAALQKLFEKRDLLKNQLSTLLSDRAFEDIKRADFETINTNFNIPEKIEFSYLDNRPDRIKSELELEKSGIDIKIAKRDFLPNFIIMGNLGLNMYNLSSSHKFLADIGVVPTLDLFTGGRKVQMLKLKKDRYNIALERYEKTILTSIQEANDALFSLKTAGNIENIFQKRQVLENSELNNVLIKQGAGVADNLDVLYQKEKLVLDEAMLISSKINKLIAAINLYQALGGQDFEEIKL